MVEHDTLLYMVDYLERKKQEVYGKYCRISTKDQMALYEDLLFFGVMRGVGTVLQAKDAKDSIKLSGAKFLMSPATVMTRQSYYYTISNKPPSFWLLHLVTYTHAYFEKEKLWDERLCDPQLRK
ncbi:hypothetical protein H5410_053897 [Solanum commersonii]|uniref:Uncharacterized protein n=1 Tax=Solanum commersonii TaxID=4109 RepID=A0A9J5X7N5_SOLCO|nr:hypothetical protein H5410_053897 [Solanum commersonii]